MVVQKEHSTYFPDAYKNGGHCRGRPDGGSNVLSVSVFTICQRWPYPSPYYHYKYNRYTTLTTARHSLRAPLTCSATKRVPFHPPSPWIFHLSILPPQNLLQITKMVCSGSGGVCPFLSLRAGLLALMPILFCGHKVTMTKCIIHVFWRALPGLVCPARTPWPNLFHLCRELIWNVCMSDSRQLGEQRVILST